MTLFARSIALAFLLAASGFGGRAACAQAAPVRYWTPNWLGFGGMAGASAEGEVAGLDGSDPSGARTRFPNGWFVGPTRGGTGINSLGRLGAFGNFGALSSEGVQFGYTFNNAPLSVYAGFDTLKYSPGPGGPFAAFDAASGTLPGYSAQAGVEFRPTSNLSLSIGVGVTQPGRLDGDVNPALLPGASPFLFNGRR